MKLADHTAHYKSDAVEFDYFEEGSAADRDSARRIQQAVLHAAKLTPGDVILDIGSGGGWLLRDVDASHGARVVSVDLGKRNLQQLRQLHGERALTVVADAARLPFRENAFSCVIASEVLEHCNNPGDVVDQAASVLRPGGRLVASTPYREKLRYSLCIHCNRPTPLNAHLHSFNEHTLRSFFENAQLRDVRYDLLQNKLLQHLRISSLLRFLPFPLWRVIDRMCTFVIAKSHTIVVRGHR